MQCLSKGAGQLNPTKARVRDPFERPVLNAVFCMMFVEPS